MKDAHKETLDDAQHIDPVHVDEPIVSNSLVPETACRLIGPMKPDKVKSLLQRRHIKRKAIRKIT